MYFKDFGKVSGYYMGKKATCEIGGVSSSPITWSILISRFQKIWSSFNNFQYLKNNPLLKNHYFQCTLHCFTVIRLQSPQIWKITKGSWHFLETRYQNGPRNGRRLHHSKLTGCILAHIVIWYFPKVIKIHPWTNTY